MPPAPRIAYFQVLYTPQLKQKRKKWYDGKCALNFSSNKMKLMDEEGRLLAEELWNGESHNLPEPGTQLFFERFLVELDCITSVKMVNTEASPKITASAIKATRQISIERNRPTLGIQWTRKPSIKADKVSTAHISSSIEPELEALTSTSSSIEQQSGLKPQTELPERVQLPDMGPPLDEILPIIGRMKPMGIDDSLKEQSRPATASRGSKYAPWGDPYSELDNDSYGDRAVNAIELNFDTTEISTSTDALHQTPNKKLCYEAATANEDQTASGALEENGRQDSGENSLSNRKEKHEDDAAHNEHVDVENAEDWETTLTAPDSYDLHSDLDSEVEFVTSDTASQRKSYFEDMPADPPQEGPWTKEAYLLFSWHRPVVKNEVES